MADPLTALTVKNLKADPSKKRIEVADGANPGLRVLVLPTSKKSWVFRYQDANGRPVKLTLGNAEGPGSLSLAEAREQASLCRKQLNAGLDPADQRRQARTAEAARIEQERKAARNHEDLIENALDRYVERHLKHLGRKSIPEIRRLFDKEVKPAWKRRKVQDVTRRDVRQLIDDIGERGAPTTANRTLANLKAFFSWCIDQEFIEHSPCQRVQRFTKEVSRDRILSDRELHLLLRAVERLAWPWRQFFDVVLLTAQRRQEVAGMRWSELDLDASMPVWKLPAERTKNNRPHEVPLPARVVQILRQIDRIEGSDFVFTTTGKTAISGFSHAKIDLDAEMLAIAKEDAGAEGEEAVVLAPWRLHDLRRTAASVMARLQVRVEVVEKVLNHVSGSFAGIVGVYQRYDFLHEKERALSAWDVFLQAFDQPKGSNVVTFSRKA